MNEDKKALASHLRVKRFFYLAIHITFVSSILYAFYHFIQTPRADMVTRRLWAYENWIILSFYALFVYLILADREGMLKKKEIVERFRRILRVNLILLLVPWGMCLLLAPQDLLVRLGLFSFYWRILGGFSLVGFLIYLFPYKFYTHKISYIILLFGIIDNFLAATIVLLLFFQRQVPLVAVSAVPLLYYFSFFFWEQTHRYYELNAQL
jgi:hypothetical protein